MKLNPLVPLQSPHTLEEEFHVCTRPSGKAGSGAVRDYAELAKLGQVSRARITQIMNLRHLAPDIQEQILFLPRIQEGRDRIHVESLQPLAATLDWQVQRRRWNEMRAPAS